MRKRATFYGAVVEGKLLLQAPGLFKAFVQSFDPADKIQIIVEKQSDSLSENQMKYYYGVVIPAGMAHTGYETPQQMDLVFKALFLTENPDSDFERIKSKMELDAYDMSDFIEKCIRFLNNEGITVPEADKTWKLKRAANETNS
jgi:hypothetical protein